MLSEALENGMKKYVKPDKGCSGGRTCRDIQRGHGSTVACRGRHNGQQSMHMKEGNGQCKLLAVIRCKSNRVLAHGNCVLPRSALDAA